MSIIVRALYVVLIIFGMMVPPDASSATVYEVSTDPSVQYNTMYSLDGVQSRIRYVRDRGATPPKTYAVCGDDRGKSGKREICVQDFKNQSMQPMQALKLAQLYAAKKGDSDLICSAKYRTSWRDDYIRCATPDGKTAYEFRFDNLNASIDKVIKMGTAASVCILDCVPPKIDNGAANADGAFECCAAKNCNVLNNDLKDFGYSAETISNRDTCRVNFGDVRAKNYQLRTAYGIDNRRFMKLQIKSTQDLHTLLRHHVENKLGTPDFTFSCNHSFNTYYTGNMTNPKDDILTCYVNDRPVDFLFDDMNEKWTTVSDGGTAALQCISVYGGNYQGGRCHGFTREQCLGELNSAIEGGTAWDETLETCVLKNARAAENITKVAKGVAVVGVAVAMSGAAIAGGVGMTIYTVIMIDAGAVLTATGTAMVEMGKYKTSKEVAAILAKTGMCKCTNECARDAYLALQDGISKISKAETDDILAILQEENRLLDCLSHDGPVLLDLAQYGDQLVDNENIKLLTSPSFSEKSPGQKLQIVGTVFQMFGAALSVGSLASPSAIEREKLWLKQGKLLEQLEDIAKVTWTDDLERLYSGVRHAKSIKELNSVLGIQTTKTAEIVNELLDAINAYGNIDGINTYLRGVFSPNQLY